MALRCRVAAVFLLVAADCASALLVPSRGGLHARQVANPISRARTRPVCVATSDEDKALLDASKKVTLVAKRFGTEQGKAAQKWVEAAVKSGDASTESLMQMQQALFEECSVDDESGRCKALSESIDELTSAVADRRSGNKVDSFQLLTGATPIQQAATKLRDAAASFGPMQKDAADMWIKKLTSGDASDAQGLLEEQVVLFGECVLAEGASKSNCQQLEEALADLQLAIDTCDVSTPEKEEACKPEEVAAELAKEAAASGAPAKESGRKRRAIKRFFSGIFSSGKKADELSPLAVASFLAAPEQVDATLKGASVEELVAKLKGEGVSEDVIGMARVAVLPFLASSLEARGETCDVVLVGCGVPKRGMGWYHAKQMLEGDVPSAKLTSIVEPWFLGPGADSPPGETFGEWANEMGATHGTQFYKSVDELKVSGACTLALISGRTADNPRLLKEVIEAGCTQVFLEKPGAPTVAELEEMKKYAAEKGVPVYMGYNKNVTPYVLKALEFERANAGAETTFVHNNAYKEEELPECFERNAEGMLKNMAIHELALLATYYGVTVDNIESVTPDAEYSRVLTLKGPSGETFTDFAKIGFSVTTKDGKSVTVKADRCGSDEGGNSIASVAVGGEEKFRTETPDAELKKYCEEQARDDPELMPYFALQSEDYITLKERATAHILSGKDGPPEGMATIDVAVEALKCAEYLTPKLTAALK